MASALILGGALANCGRNAPTEEFLQLLARETPELAVFRFRPMPKPGISAKAALDWQAILGTAADLLAFAGVLWAAYERYVKPKLGQKVEGLKPFLFINVRRPDGTFVQFSLGHDYKDKEVCVEHFTRQVEELRSLPCDEEETEVLSAISQHEDWVRIHVRNRDKS